ncbi:MAG: hypothetical protein A2W23_09285 [Planctomycetes bacterium RBG_16_43_13]|nr:MAG: hypothetical protein A2W23_09285 [Planctomycetes bacterium RBG_16_43_13]
MINKTCSFSLVFVAITYLIACNHESPPQQNSHTTSATPKVIAIKGGLVKTMWMGDIDGATILIKDGIISAVGKDVSIPNEAQTIDARGKIIIPGMIDSNTRIGLVEIDAVNMTVDADEGVDPITPHVSVVDAINPDSTLIPVNRIEGITTVIVAPGEGNLISGTSALINLDGRLVSDMIIKSPLAMHINLGNPPKDRYSSKNILQTRMGLVAKAREILTKAREYLNKKETYQKRTTEYKADLGKWQKTGGKNEKGEEKKKPDEPTPPDTDVKLEALLPVIKGELPVVIRAHRLDDIHTAIRLADEFKLKLIISHATEGYKIAKDIAERKIPVIIGPINTQPDNFETLGATYENAVILAKAGIKIAIQTNDSHNVRNLPFMAGLAVAYGLDREEALRAITINPAEIFSVADKVGSIRPGAYANLVICTDDPFQPRNRIEHVFIKGKDIELRSRQTELYEKYK